MKRNYLFGIEELNCNSDTCTFFPIFLPFSFSFFSKIWFLIYVIFLALPRVSLYVVLHIIYFHLLQYLKDLDDLRSQLAATQATADASDALALSSQLQCLVLMKELDEKNHSIKEHEIRVNRLADQLNLLQKDLQAREFSQKQLKDEVTRMEDDILQALAKAGADGDGEVRSMLDEVSPKNFDKINKLLAAKDEEITMLRDEIRIMSAHWNLKTKELESQVHYLYFFLLQ